MKSLLVVCSYHHHNTEKIARAMARVLGARITTPRQVTPEELRECDLAGFGSGIYSGKHHQELLDLAGRLPRVTGRKAFIFSTSAMTGKEKVDRDHSLLREKLQSAGYVVVGEFSCKGFNTNSFLKLVGGMNKGRPNAGDLAHAEAFAMNLRENKQKTAGEP